MPRILGVDIPNDKPTDISLRYIYGIGPTLAEQLCEQAGDRPDKRARDLTEDELAQLAALLDNEYSVEGQLRRQVQQNIARLRDIGCYRGVRHRKRPAGPRPADPDQRPHPQGPAQDGRRQEGRQGHALSASRGRDVRMRQPRSEPDPAESPRRPRHPPLRTGSVTQAIDQERRTRGQEPRSGRHDATSAGHRPHQGDVQQHDRHDHRHQRRHAVLGLGRHGRLQGQPQEHAVRRPAGRRDGRRRRRRSSA